MKVVAVQKIYYASREHQPGDEFECSDSDARILTAHDLPGGQKCKKVEAAPAVVTRAVEPQSEQQTDPKPDSENTLFTEGGEGETAPKRRKYQRRDMTAEE